MLVLVVVGVSSWLTARSLAKPLGKLAATATSFGAGELSARVGLSRSDELGDVAKAFDEMAERVTQSIRAERELLANVSHELRTPLQRIRIALDLAAEGDASTARESLREITEDLVELERIVDDVLTATRLSLREGARAGAIPPLRREPVELPALLAKAAGRFRGAHPERRLEVASPPGNGPALEGDAVLLRRVVDNLLDNAHKYTEDPSRPIRLSCHVTGEQIVVEVVDEGIGIAKADLERVFEPFFRVDRSRTRATGGLGLGLVLSRRIVEAHHGTLTLESEPGKGTTARIELPAR
jgi:signal transduction histidine kinase